MTYKQKFEKTLTDKLKRKIFVKKYILLTLFALSLMQMNYKATNAMEIEESLGEGSSALSMPIKEKECEIKEYFESQKKHFPDLSNLSRKFDFSSFYSDILKNYPGESKESVVACFIKCGVEKIMASEDWSYDEDRENYYIIENLAFHPAVQKYFNSTSHKVDPTSERAKFFRNLIKVQKVSFKKNTKKNSLKNILREKLKV